MSVTARAHNALETYQSNEALAQVIETERLEALDHAHKFTAIERRTLLMTYMSTIFLPVSFLLSLFPTAMLGFNGTGGFIHLLTTWLQMTFFPRTSCSISDLDQAVAVTVGATILAFNLHSVMKAHYKILSAKNASSLETAGMELHGRGDVHHRSTL